MRKGLVAVLAAVAALAGCAQVPHSGSVKVGPRLSGLSGQADAVIHTLPAGPLPGATPSGIVTGFLRAMIDGAEDNYTVGRSFLSEGATWKTGQTLLTYDPQTLQVVRSGMTVVVHAQRTGTISPRGSFTLQPGPITRRFALVRDAGQWRIAHAPSGVLISADDAQRSLQSANVYYFNASWNRVVPEPLLLSPEQPGLATTLIEDLVAGPSPSLRSAVNSAVPPGVSLIGNVPVNANGVADVDFTSGARQVSSIELSRLAAQIVWTLRQLVSVTAVQLLVNGSPLSAPNVASLQPVHAWGQFDPDIPSTATGAVLIQNGRPAGLGTAVPSALDVAALAAPSQSADGSQVAALRTAAGRTTLLTGTANGTLGERVFAPFISAPAFDLQGDVFVAQGVVGAERLVEYPVHGAARTVATSGLLHGSIQSLAISPDASRIAAIVGSAGLGELVVGSLALAGSHPSVQAAQLVLPASRDVESVAWGNVNQLVCTVAAGAGRRAVAEVGVDGYQNALLSSDGLTAPPVQVAAAPGHRILAAGGGSIWSLNGRQWEQVASGTDPSYPG
jgi:hypothetical protein